MDAEKKESNPLEMSTRAAKAQVQTQCIGIEVAAQAMYNTVSLGAAAKDEDALLKQLELHVEHMTRALRRYQGLRTTFKRQMLRRSELAMSAPAVAREAYAAEKAAVAREAREARKQSRNAKSRI